DAEDVASGLTLFRDALPSQAAHLTTVISELFAISSVLRRIDAAQADPRREPSFYRIENDLRIVCPSLRLTLEDAFHMFGRERERPTAMVWDDLEHRMRDEEGAAFGERLGWVHDYLDEMLAELDGFASAHLEVLRRRMATLLETQEVARVALRRPSSSCKYVCLDALLEHDCEDQVLNLAKTQKAARTARPGAQRYISYRHVEGTTSPISATNSWDYVERFPPPVPEVPLSPTFTSSSSQTLDSSHTSYSNYGFAPVISGPPPMPSHWALDVFDGNCPVSPFKTGHGSDTTSCHGTQNSEALHRLLDDGYIMVSEVDFDRAAVQVRLYWRPVDNRTRVLYMTKSSRSQDLLYCVPLTQLRAIRKDATLQLCRASSQDGHLKLWAKLNFVFYERMVLFYSTFVAMKRQDSQDPLPTALIEDLDLREKQEFGGVIRDRDLRHALRLFRDTNSGVVRLEASALRGPREGVPIWTAFITRYSFDPDWMALESGGIVTMAALKPPPYVFLAGYGLVRNRHGDYILQFDTTDDAADFVRTWSGVCRNSKR
ncbi:hypothetical protein LTR95_002364, partial [Oleoguttula sp. CCFEE 5521]